jgi:hypothetical protein
MLPRLPADAYDFGGSRAFRPEVRMPRRSSAAAILLVALPLLADPLRPAPLHAQPFTVHDSAGVRVVTSSAPLWRVGEAWRVDPQPVVQIGAADGAAAYMFSNIFQIRFLPEQQLAVVDFRDPAIRVFDAHGRHVRTIGRQGGGSGEFMAAPTIALDARGDIVAWDPLARRLSWFDRDGRLRAERSLGTSPAAGALRPMAIWDAWQLLADGSIVATGPVTTDRRAGLIEFGRQVSVVDAGGRRSIEIGTFPLSRTIEFRPGNVFDDAFSERSPVAVRNQPRRIIVGTPGAWELRAYASDGALREIVRAPIARRPLDAARVRQERARVLERVERGFRDAPRADVERAFDAAARPDSLPAMLRIFDDDAGHLWVQRWNGPGDDARFDIIDAQGRWLGSVNVPATLGEIMSVAANHVAVVWRDELDVPYIRIHRLARSR